MRAVTLLVSLPGDYPTAELFEGDAVLERERIYNLNVLEDGSIVLLGRVSGDLKHAREFIEQRMDVLGFSISNRDEDGGLVFIHARPPAKIARFIELPRKHEVFFDFPIEATSDGRLKIVMIGETNDDLQQALADIPLGIGVEIERIGPYTEDTNDIRALLTDRQREILDVALDLGYYEIPRRTTHRDIAAELDVTAGTVSEHLQKIEARIIGSANANLPSLAGTDTR